MANDTQKDKSGLLEYYSRRSANYDLESSWMLRDSQLLELHKEPFREVRLDTILDVATGTGIIGGIFAGSGTWSIGIDLSKDMLVAAKKRVSDVIRAIGESIPLSSNAFDLVTCRQGLHYMRLGLALSEIYRVSKKYVLLSEIVCVSEGDIDWWKSLFEILSPGRANIFTKDDLIEAVSTSGFDIKSIMSHETTNTIRSWMSGLRLSRQITDQLLRQFESAPMSIIENYKISRISGSPQTDFLFHEPWVIIIGSKT